MLTSHSSTLRRDLGRDLLSSFCGGSGVRPRSSLETSATHSVAVTPLAQSLFGDHTVRITASTLVLGSVTHRSGHGSRCSTGPVHRRTTDGSKTLRRETLLLCFYLGLSKYRLLSLTTFFFSSEVDVENQKRNRRDDGGDSGSRLFSSLISDNKCLDGVTPPLVRGHHD